MKKLIVFAIIMFGLSQVCFAQLVKPKAKGAYGKPAAARPAPTPNIEVSGKVAAVSASKIVIADKMGKESTLAIVPSTLILGKDSKPTTLDKIMKEESVRAKYRENQGVKTAVAIQIVG